MKGDSGRCWNGICAMDCYPVSLSSAHSSVLVKIPRGSSNYSSERKNQGQSGDKALSMGPRLSGLLCMNQVIVGDLREAAQLMLTVS